MLTTCQPKVVELKLGCNVEDGPDRLGPVSPTTLTPRVPPRRMQRLAVALDPGVPQQRPRIRTAMRVLHGDSGAAQDCV